MARRNLETFGAALVFLSVLGFGRFSYGPLLPLMRHDLMASYQMYGIVAAANFTGYFVGSAMVPGLLSLSQNKSLWNGIAIGLTALSLMATAVSHTTAELMGFRFLTGASSGLATVLTLAIYAGDRERAGSAFSGGIIWAGAALGMVFCGFALQAFGLAFGAHAWRAVWFAMGALSLPVLYVFARVQSENAGPASKGPIHTFGPKGNGDFLRVATGYGIFACGYIMYVTYAPSHWDAALAGTSPMAAFWTVMGLAALVGALFWGWLFERYPTDLILTGSLVVCALGAFIGVATGGLAATLSGALAGFAMLGPPTIITALARRLGGPECYAGTLSRLTAVFAFGQIIGPLLGGVVADGFGLRIALGSSAALLLVAAAVITGRSRVHSMEHHHAYVH